jgi:magnesium transporter
MTPDPQPQTDPTRELALIVDSGNAEHLAAFLHLLPPEDTTYTISHLDEDRQTRMLSLLSAEHSDLAADLMEHFVDEQAADMIEQLKPSEAAAIVDEMDSDEQTDVLAELDDEDAEAILDEMDPAEAEDARQRLTYDEDAAGGLMITEYLAYREVQSVDDVIADLRAHADEYDEYEVRYAYLTDPVGLFKGVVTMRSLVMAPAGRKLADLTIKTPVSVLIDTHMDDLADLFDRVDFSAVPVLDADGQLVGVVQRAAVQEALSESANEDLLMVAGIVAGEEFRSMPMMSRLLRRLAYLVPIMLLLLISASVIHLFIETVAELPVLAMFLPVVAGLCGSGGNQAVGVSLREVSLGLITPGDYMRVLIKEAALGLFAGLFLGVLLFLIVWLWQQDFYLALVIGGSVPIVFLIAKTVGGTAPLALRSIGLDPAMASGPAVTTVADLFSFFIVLLFATLLLSKIVVDGG